MFKESIVEYIVSYVCTHWSEQKKNAIKAIVGTPQKIKVQITFSKEYHITR